MHLCQIDRNVQWLLRAEIDLAIAELGGEWRFGSGRPRAGRIGCLQELRPGPSGKAEGGEPETGRRQEMMNPFRPASLA